MNNRVNNLYVAIHNNKVIYASTQLMEFHRTIQGLITGVKSRTYYQKKFVENPTYQHQDDLNKIYIFQKVW